jgi:hypothetical protein
MVRPKGADGPRTPKGKEASAKNSLKHGSYSVVAVLPNENQKDFDQLLAQIRRDLKPIDFVEDSLIHDLAVITWKKLRLEKLEQAYFLKKLNEPITQDEFKSCGLLISDESYQIWLKTESLSESELKELRELVKEIKPYCFKKIAPKLLQQLSEKYPVLEHNLFNNYRSNKSTLDGDPSYEDMAKLVSITPDSGINRYFTSVVFEKCIDHVNDYEWLHKNKEKIEVAIQAIKEERLWKLSQVESGGRASEDLRRSFSKALSELRKHQEWRMNHRLIDVDKE